MACARALKGPRDHKSYQKLAPQVPQGTVLLEGGSSRNADKPEELSNTKYYVLRACHLVRQTRCLSSGVRSKTHVTRDRRQ